jgi:hypothetical protein
MKRVLDKYGTVIEFWISKTQNTERKEREKKANIENIRTKWKLLSLHKVNRR